jgi:endonuclease-3
MRDLPFRLPEVPDAEKRRARSIYAALEALHPDAHCELDFTCPHELLVATMLSAQTTDVAVNKATPALFDAFPTPADYAAASPPEIEPYIRSIGLFRNKARHVHAAMTTLVEAFGGEVPGDMDDLLSLKGVARKTANVVLSNAFDEHHGVVVDTHVERLGKKYLLAPEDATVAMVERHLAARFPRPRWGMLSHLLIFHGRRIAPARGGRLEDDPIYQRFVARRRARAKAPARSGS